MCINEMPRHFVRARGTRVDTPAGRPSTDARRVSQHYVKDKFTLCLGTQAGPQIDLLPIYHLSLGEKKKNIYIYI